MVQKLELRFVFFCKVMCNFYMTNRNLDVCFKQSHFYVSGHTLHKIILKLLVKQNVLLLKEYVRVVLNGHEDYSLSIECFFDLIFFNVVCNGTRLALQNKPLSEQKKRDPLLPNPPLGGRRLYGLLYFAHHKKGISKDFCDHFMDTRPDHQADRPALAGSVLQGD